MKKLYYIFFLISGIFLCPVLSVFGQTNSSDELEYEEFTIKLNVDKLGTYEMEAVYFEDALYLPIIDLFRKLEIYLIHSQELDTISGFILSPENTYSLDLISNKIKFRSKEKTLTNNQIISTYKDVYLPSKVLEELFGMTMNFNLRELTVYLRSDIELPIIKQLRIKNLRKNLALLNGETISDTVIARKWNLAKGGILDWGFQSTIDQSGQNSQMLRASLGMELLGGGFNIRTNLTRDSLIQLQNTSFKWHYVNDRLPVIKQIELGNINVNLKGQTLSNFYGVKFTNTAYSLKKSFGKYLIERKTQPGWEVELYMNGVLINFTTADLNGYFNFEIPLVFGNSNIVLRYYGPWGQEDKEELQINIPFTFTAQKHLEYQINSGVTADSLHIFFNKSQFSYGINRRLTLNLEYDHFSGNVLNPHILSSSINSIFGKNILFNYTYLHQSNHSFEFLLRTKKNFVISMKHKQFLKGQTIIQNLNTSESDLGFNCMLLNKKLKIYLRNSNRAVVNNNNFSFLSESSMSFFYRRLNSSFTFLGGQQSSLSWNTSFNMKKNWSIVHNTQYNVTRKRLESSYLQIQKKVNKLFFVEGGVNYAYLTKELQVNVAFYFNFNKVRSGINSTFSKNQMISNQTLAGSLIMASGPKKIMATNSNGIGKSGIDVFVFLDVNHNNIQDENEPLMKDVSVGINRGKQVLTENDSIHRFVALEPYATYLITVGNTGFESISWILEKETWSVVSDPNQIKQVFVPIKPMGEVNVMVYLNRNGKQVAAKRMLVHIVNETGQVVAKGLTETDGSFSFLGLKPGKYQIKFDEKQLKGLNLSKEYKQTSFDIKESMLGDYVGGIEVILSEN
ncbi:MAG: hypothetical protein ACK476_08935 [Fluviicola sp.]